MSTNYIKTVWEDGKTPICAEKLNNIEKGIEELSKTSLSVSDIEFSSGITGQIIDTNQLILGLDPETLDEVVTHPTLMEGPGVKLVKVYTGESYVENAEEGGTYPLYTDGNESESECFHITDDISGTILYLGYNSEDGIYGVYSENPKKIKKGIKSLIVERSNESCERVYVNPDTDQDYPKTEGMTFRVINHRDTEIRVFLPILRIGIDNSFTYRGWVIPASTNALFTLRKDSEVYTNWDYVDSGMTQPNPPTPIEKEKTLESTYIALDKDYINSIVEHPKIIINNSEDEVLKFDENYTPTLDYEKLDDILDHPRTTIKCEKGVKLVEETLPDGTTQVTLSVDYDKLDYSIIDAKLNHPRSTIENGTGISITENSGKIKINVDESYLSGLIRRILQNGN